MTFPGHVHEAGGNVEFRVGDMLDPAFGEFDYIVAMDSLIHYNTADMERVVATLAQRARRGMVFTVAPRTPLLALMHLSGRLFPRNSRSPDINPVPVERLKRHLSNGLEHASWRCRADRRVASGFYTSHGLCWERG